MIRARGNCCNCWGLVMIPAVKTSLIPRWCSVIFHPRITVIRAVRVSCLVWNFNSLPFPPRICEEFPGFELGAARKPTREIILDAGAGPTSRRLRTYSYPRVLFLRTVILNRSLISKHWLTSNRSLITFGENTPTVHIWSIQFTASWRGNNIKIDYYICIGNTVCHSEWTYVIIRGGNSNGDYFMLSVFDRLLNERRDMNGSCGSDMMEGAIWWAIKKLIVCLYPFT